MKLTFVKSAYVGQQCEFLWLLVGNSDINSSLA